MGRDANMSAYVDDHLFGGMGHVLVEQHMQLLAREQLQEAIEVSRIKTACKEPPLGTALALQIFAGIAADHPAPVEHAVIGIGALHGIAQLHDQPCSGQRLEQAIGGIGMRQIVSRLFAKNAVRRRFVEQRGIPVRAAGIVTAEIMGFGLGQPQIGMAAQLMGDPGGRPLDRTDDDEMWATAVRKPHRAPCSMTVRRILPI